MQSASCRTKQDALLEDRASWRPPLRDLDLHKYALASSSISLVEISRTLLRIETPEAAERLTRMAMIDVDSLVPSNAVLQSAATLPVRFLKSLDAIHVASALAIQPDIVLTNDRQMQRSCEELGLAVA